MPRRYIVTRSLFFEPAPSAVTFVLGSSNATRSPAVSAAKETSPGRGILRHLRSMDESKRSCEEHNCQLQRSSSPCGVLYLDILEILFKAH